VRAFPLVFRGVDSVCGCHCHHSADEDGVASAAALRSMAMLMVFLCRLPVSFFDMMH